MQKWYIQKKNRFILTTKKDSVITAKYCSFHSHELTIKLLKLNSTIRYENEDHLVTRDCTGQEIFDFLGTIREWEIKIYI